MTDSDKSRIFKELKALKTKHTRDKKGLFFAEGERLVSSVPRDIIEYIVYSEGGEKSLKSRLNMSYLPSYTLSDRLFSEISDTVSPQGVLCVCRQFSASVDDILNKKPEFIVVCEEIQDPGNLGTIIRTADAGGASGIILSKGCADIFSPKIIRGAMGSVFNIPILTGAHMGETIAMLKDNGIQILAAHLKGSITPYETDLKKPTAILIGNEARGLKDETADKADVLVRLPMLGGAESLNASVACGILIYDVVRQRYTYKGE